MRYEARVVCYSGFPSALHNGGGGRTLQQCVRQRALRPRRRLAHTRLCGRLVRLPIISFNNFFPQKITCLSLLLRHKFFQVQLENLIWGALPSPCKTHVWQFFRLFLAEVNETNLQAEGSEIEEKPDFFRLTITNNRYLNPVT